MSVYDEFPLPLLSYGILHRPRTGVPREVYRGTILEMHRGVDEESLKFSLRHQKSLLALSQKQAQILRGGLSQFLQTPIRSDSAEVQRIFQDAFDEHRALMGEPGPYGATASWAGSAVHTSYGPAWVKKLEANGRRSRRHLGLEPPRVGGDLFESVFVVRGGLNLDVLEYIVRDRLGIYASAHGRHLDQAAPAVVATHNMIHASGGDFWKSLPSAWGEAVLLFEKPALPYDAFRTSLAVLIDRAIAASGAPGATLWQRKLGLGRGTEFALRMLLSGHAQVPDILDTLRSAHEPGFAKEIFGREAGLLVKELFHPRPE